MAGGKGNGFLRVFKEILFGPSHQQPILSSRRKSAATKRKWPVAVAGDGAHCRPESSSSAQPERAVQLDYWISPKLKAKVAAGRGQQNNCSRKRANNRIIHFLNNKKKGQMDFKLNPLTFYIFFPTFSILCSLQN
jgi:hypothetical protein